MQTIRSSEDVQTDDYPVLPVGSLLGPSAAVIFPTSTGTPGCNVSVVIPESFTASATIPCPEGRPSLASWYSLSVLSLSEMFSAVLESSEEVDSYLEQHKVEKKAKKSLRSYSRFCSEQRDTIANSGCVLPLYFRMEKFRLQRRN